MGPLWTPIARWLTPGATAPVYETDPFGVKEPVVHSAMDAFTHEACAVDPERKVVYETEDEPDGGFYRFIPDAWPDLSRGRLEIMVGEPDQTSGAVTWAPVPDPSAADEQTRYQVNDSKPFWRPARSP